MTSNTEALAREHAEATARAAELEAELVRRQTEREAARQARLEEHDRAFVAGYAALDEQMQAEERAAQQQFRQAVLDDPVIAAWVKLRSLRWKRTHLRNSFGSALRNLGDHRRAESVADLAYTDPRLLEDVLRHAEDEARALAADDADAREAARQAAATDGAT